jgi:PAS domain S-box-containing protein
VSEVSFRDISGLFSEPLALVNPSGLILSCNRAFQAVFSEAGPVEGRKLPDITEGAPEGALRFLDACTMSRSFVPGVIRVASNGRTTAYRCEGALLQPPDKDTEARVLVRLRTHEQAVSDFGLLNQQLAELAHEVHSRREAEEKLSASERRYRALFHGANDGVVTYQFQGEVPSTFLDVNDAVCRLLEYSREEILTLTPIDLHAGGEAEFAMKRRQLFDKSSLITESTLLTSHGKKVTVEASAHLFEIDGEPTVLSIYRDITHRKRLERERMRLLARERRAREEAERSEKRLAFLAEAGLKLASGLDLKATAATSAGLLVPSFADGCTVSILSEEGGLEHVAYASSEPWTEEEHAAFMSRLEKSGWGPRKATTSQEAIFHSDLNPAITLESGATDIRPGKPGLRSIALIPMWARGSVFGAITIWRNATKPAMTPDDHKLVQEIVRRTAAEMHNAYLYKVARDAQRASEEMSRLKTAFLANMSHEIRTPLTGIMGFASLLVRNAQEDKTRDFATRIESGGRRLMETLDSVLALSQLEARQNKLDMEPITVYEEVHAVVELMHREATAKGLYLNLEADTIGRSARARLDRGALSSILHNLIGNSIKFTGTGGITVSVHADEDVRISVRDTGIGIESEFLEHIFEPFRQESRGWSRTHEGAGLGLAITHRLTEEMGGEITVESAKGEGTCFDVRFPPTKARSRARQIVGEAGADYPHSQTRSEASILIVEDNEDARLLMENLMSSLGHVRLVTSSEQILDIIRQFRFNLVLMDINLGGGPDGTDIIKIMRSMPDHVDVPVIAVTAYALPGDRERLMKAGFQDYLPKPFSADELLLMARKHLIHALD